MNRLRSRVLLSGSTRDAKGMIDSSSMKGRPLATDCDAMTVTGDEVASAGLSELLEFTAPLDPNRLVFVEFSQ